MISAPAVVNHHGRCITTTSFRSRHQYNLSSGVSCVNRQNDYIGVAWLLLGNRRSFLGDDSLRLSSKRKNGCARELLGRATRLSRGNHRKVLELREALRQFLHLAPSDRLRSGAGTQLSAAAANFPLIVRISEAGEIELLPEGRGVLSGLGRILADLQRAGESGNLDRLKMSASEECSWVFYDRSRPALVGGAHLWSVTIRRRQRLIASGGDSGRQLKNLKFSLGTTEDRS
jgi:hypothetical protein